MAVAAVRKVAALPALAWWLMVVGTARLGLTSFGFFNAPALRARTYSNTHVTDVHGRTFGVCTLLSCTLCFLCALDLENKSLYVATFLSFIYGYSHLRAEYLVYRTMPAANLGGFGFFAVISIVWMSVHQRNTRGAPRAAKQS